MPFVSGSSLGPYEIVAPLGAGGMGEVYKSRDTRLDRTVVIKILSASLATDPQFRDTSAQYMAPEQLEGRETDAMTDIFAFGAVVYEMIGKKTFEGKSQASLISSIMSSHPPSVSTLQEMVPAGLDRLIEKCLVKDPEQRWQSMRHVRMPPVSGVIPPAGGCPVKR